MFTITANTNKILTSLLVSIVRLMRCPTTETWNLLYWDVKLLVLSDYSHVRLFPHHIRLFLSDYWDVRLFLSDYWHIRLLTCQTTDTLYQAIFFILLGCQNIFARLFTCQTIAMSDYCHTVSGYFCWIIEMSDYFCQTIHMSEYCNVRLLPHCIRLFLLDYWDARLFLLDYWDVRLFLSDYWHVTLLTCWNTAVCVTMTDNGSN